MPGIRLVRKKELGDKNIYAACLFFLPRQDNNHHLPGMEFTQH